MSIPISAQPLYKIEILDQDATLIRTITSQADAIHTHDVLTSEIGNFTFTLPAQRSAKNVYTDILTGYTCKISMGYQPPRGTPTYTLLHVGKIKKISAPLQTQGGYIRVYEGRQLSAILESRQKKNKRWTNIDADVVADELADDLGLTPAFDAETTDVSLTVKTETYKDILAKISDYWIDAGNQLKKDFWVDNTAALVWKNRPFRTVGVESFVVGQKQFTYQVFRDILPIKNNITVYGHASNPVPSDKDEWSEATSEWTGAGGTTVTQSSADPKAGSQSLVFTQTNGTIAATHTFDETLNIRNLNNLNFYYKTVCLTPEVHILAPDTSNYYKATLSISGSWVWFSKTIGDNGIYHADENPSGAWTPQGSPNWYNMTGIKFISGSQVGPQTITIDKLFLYPERYIYTASDATSIDDYDQQDAEYTDENLFSNTECQTRAQTLLYQLKDPVIRVNLTCAGNSNILLGDRIPVEIPNENIDADFDVVSVNHDLTTKGWSTTAACVDSANTRALPAMNQGDAIRKNFRNLKLVTSELYQKVVS
jgi:hypothetical protein